MTRPGSGPRDPQARNLSAWLRSQWIPLVVLGLYIWAFSEDSNRAWLALQQGLRIFVSVLPIIASVFGLVGLIQVWISRDLVVRLLGKEGGFRGLLIAMACGTILIGPAYIIFPLLMSIKRQGARWAVITIVLSAYTVKIPMIPLEIQFLGWEFSVLRAFLTLLFAIPTGLMVEAFMDRQGRQI